MVVLKFDECVWEIFRVRKIACEPQSMFATVSEMRQQIGLAFIFQLY